MYAEGLTQEGHNGERPEVDFCGCHGDVEDIVGYQGTEPAQQQQLPALVLHCPVHLRAHARF